MGRSETESFRSAAVDFRSGSTVHLVITWTSEDLFAGNGDELVVMMVAAEEGVVEREGDIGRWISVSIRLAWLWDIS